MIVASCAAGLLATSRAQAQQRAPRSDPGNPGFERPAVDHHKHLPSPAAARLISEETLPSVALPEELARLVRERARRWNDSVALAELYTEGSTALDPAGTGWIKGRAAVAAHEVAGYRQPFEITPIGYGVQGSTGHVAGYLTRGTGDSTRYFGNLLLALERGADGAWRIAAETATFPGPERQEPIDSDHLIAELDSAGIRRAVVLSVAYWFGSPRFNLPDEYAKVRAENDYTARQVARHADRLVGFCSVSPLRDYALQEIERCAGQLHLRGLKLHFGSSRVDLLNPEHLEKTRRVFAAANRLHLPITVHVRGSRQPRGYGAEHARVFVERLLTAAPDVPVTIAHLWGGAEFADSALAVFADALAAHDPRTRNLWFDVTDIMPAIRDSDPWMATVVRRIRQIGTNRILWGSDMSPPSTPAREAWLEFRALPLTDAEFRAIAGNVAPYLR